MSNKIHSSKKIATFVKTLTSHTSAIIDDVNSHDSDNYYRLLHDVIDSLKDDLFNEDMTLDDISENEFEKKLFEYISNASMRDFQAAHPEHFHMDFYRTEEQSREKTANMLDKLDKLAYPANGNSVASLFSLTKDIVSQLSERENPVEKVLNNLALELAKYSVLLNASTPITTPNIEDAATTILSAMHKSDDMTGIELGVYNQVDKIKIDQYAGSEKYLTGEEVVASRLHTFYHRSYSNIVLTKNSYIGDDAKSLFVYAGLPEFSSEGHLSVVPESTQESLLSAAKVLTRLSEFYSDPDIRFYNRGKLGETLLSDDEMKEVKNEMNQLSLSVNIMVARTLDGYAFNQNRDMGNPHMEKHAQKHDEVSY